MGSARHVLALLKSHIQGDEDQFLSIAMEVAAQEAKRGHLRFARDLKDLIDKAREKRVIQESRIAPVLRMQPKGELASFLSVRFPDERLSSMVLPKDLNSRLRRVLLEQKQQQKIRANALHPRRKLLLVGPPGSGKTFTAAALAGELQLPLFTILLEGLITKFMGETAAKLKLVFDAMINTRGVYFFDEFDAIGSRRNTSNDVGEIRRVLNSFLQLLEKDDSLGLIIAATNHPDLLDSALFRRFDDVLEYAFPDPATIKNIFASRLAAFNTDSIDWESIVRLAAGLSQADIVKAADESAKSAVLQNTRKIDDKILNSAIKERGSSLQNLPTKNA